MGNIVTMAGTVIKGAVPISDINSMEFNGLKLKVETERKNGTLDEAIVIIHKSVEIPKVYVGDPVIVIGKMQTVKNFETGHVLVYVLAECVEVIKGEHWFSQNDVMIIGELARGTNFRHTPRGTRIADMTVIVKNEVKMCKCFIPCICWNGFAEKIKEWEAGTKVELTGKLHSRNYTKQVDGRTINRTCYEVSVNFIKKAIV